MSAAPVSMSAAPVSVSAEAVFRALASGARLCIVREFITHGEQCVQDLVGCCGLGWSTVSHHLSVLKEAGIVRDDRRGKHIFYRLSLPCVADVLSCLDAAECPAPSRPPRKPRAARRPASPRR